MEHTVKFLFEDESFSYETLRAAGYTPYGGADLGEMITTAARIPEGNRDAWFREWHALAARVEETASASLAAGRSVSAREGYLRASNYYRLCEFYLRDDPRHDPRVRTVSRQGAQAFARAATLLPQPLESLRIPLDGAELPAWFVPADAGTTDPGGRSTADGRRPVLLFHGGFDSTVEECYFAAAAAAARRGYHTLIFDGPGQGSVLREQGVPFRPDWETVVGAVLDRLQTQPDVDTSRIALMGMSMGGLLAPRAAAFERRICALVAYDGVYSLRETMEKVLPPPVLDLVAEGTEASLQAADDALYKIMESDTQAWWMFANGMWTFGVSSPVALFQATAAYSLAGVAGRITCPTLVLEAQDDQFFAGQATRLRDALSAPTTYHLFTQASGAGEHCHSGAMTEFHRVLFDWLDPLMALPPTR
jgi:pimeloyl-ACP methyl ester carboxylesterase